VLFLLAAVGCGHHRPAPDTTNPKAELGVQIDSHHWSDVVISIYHDGVWERLGLAGAAKVTNFVVPWHHVGPSGLIRLRAHPIGGTEDEVTESLSVQPGQVVVWTLESSLSRSSVGVY
jgi:hypothetical protein